MSDTSAGRTHLEWICDRMAGLLDPLAGCCRGALLATICPLLAQA